MNFANFLILSCSVASLHNIIPVSSDFPTKFSDFTSQRNHSIFSNGQ